MQVLILEDFKHMSGLTAGISKLVMTLISTGGSMVVSNLYDRSIEKTEEARNHTMVRSTHLSLLLSLPRLARSRSRCLPLLCCAPDRRT